MSRLPETWVECLIGEVARIVGGGTPPSKDASNFTTGDSGMPWITPADLSGYKQIYISRGARNLTDKGFSNCSAIKMPPGSVLFSSRAPIGYVAIAANEISTNQGFKSFVLPDGLNNHFIYYYLKHIKPIAEEMATGTTFKELSGAATAKLPLVVAPVNEQKRIADKLDAVLARVDACRERLDRVPAILKRFRQSVLAAATSGKLTEEWRSMHGTQHQSWIGEVEAKPIFLPKGYERLSKQSFKMVRIEHNAGDLPSTWCIKTIADLYNSKVLVDFADGNHGSLYPRKEDFGPNGATFLTATQIGEHWEVDLDACPRLKQAKAKLLTKGWARNGDVLLTHNATVGRVGLLEKVREEILLGTSVTFYRFNNKYVEPEYARIVFSSVFFQDQLESVMKQTTRDQVPITKQVSLNFICAPIEEQREIVRRVNELFTYAGRLEARYSSARDKTEKLTPSLLAKAFRGELVPQDPSEEPASELLKRIRECTAVSPGSAPISARASRRIGPVGQQPKKAANR